MTTKVKIVEQLGETAVLLPSLIGDALGANDHLKLRLTLLQEAAGHARNPTTEPRHFGAQAGGVMLAELDPDKVVAGAQMIGPDRLHVPGANALVAGLGTDLGAMLAPLQAADPETARPYAERAARLGKSLPSAANDEIGLKEIDALASIGRDGGDSVHRLVMDLHKAINRLAAETALEVLDGAHVHALDERDRRAVKAFMRGLNRTAPLAFGHPGLGTTAVRAAGRLTIQNDIGTTDAHVLVVHVEPRTVTFTYSDVHHARAQFFISLFEKVEQLTWSTLERRRSDELEEDLFYLVTGCCTSDDEATLDRLLEFLGSRIVFLIDWNKARKALQSFVSQNQAIGILTWAAEHDFGHRAFIELGGVELVFEAVRRAAPDRIPYGMRLDETLGTGECADFLRHVLRGTSQGLAAGRSARLIRDEIQADLARRFETAESAVLTVLVRHLGLSRMLAEAITLMLSLPGLAKPEERQALARRAKLIEEKADRLTVSARDIAVRVRNAGMLRSVIDEVENATDALEDCAFLLSLLPHEGAASIDLVPIAKLSGIVVDSVTHLVRAAEAASRLPEGHRADATAALQSVDAVVVAERNADASERESLAALVAPPQVDARAMTLGLEITRALETATDHLSHAALSLRDRVLEELSA